MIIKKVTPLILLFTSFFFFVKCSKDSRSLERKADSPSQILKHMSVTMGSNTKTSVFGRAIGMNSIDVIEGNDGKIDLKFKGAPVILNNYMINFNAEKFSVTVLKPDEEYIISDSERFSSFTLNLKSREGMVSIGNKKFPMKSVASVQLKNSEKIEFIKLLALAIELFDKNQIRKQGGQWSQDLKLANRYDSKGKMLKANTAETSCYRYNFNAGITKAASEDAASKDSAVFLKTYPRCRQVGLVETTCLFSISPCASVTTFECIGGICDFRGYITE